MMVVLKRKCFPSSICVLCFYCMLIMSFQDFINKQQNTRSGGIKENNAEGECVKISFGRAPDARGFRLPYEAQSPYLG